MPDPQTISPSTADSDFSREDLQSALFAQLVLQQSNMALMMMGKVAHPESGQTVKDLEAAQLFIDTLEMLEARTKGNLTKQESNLLKQNLMNLRLHFVQAVEEKSAPAHTEAAKGTSSQEAPVGSTDQTTTATADQGATPAAEEEEHRKKFTKKY
ncbi:MAG: hypothetical protein C5B50_11245 [Verrucomicrobia bacterium]|nr:MAG: hypothetical protein C5B50_11245 [Verrucomicrobiota bacterium]